MRPISAPCSRRFSSEEGYDVEVPPTAMRRATRGRASSPDLILLDIWMPDVDGITLLREWADNALSCPVVMMSGHGTIETAVEATRLGAYDFCREAAVARESCCERSSARSRRGRAAAVS